ncbi:LysM peptidoglycan-binding domain-containing protein [Mycolicibacterium aubagnense]|uniref:Lectin n=1 Tax=Mycolicibacterium aubagnense TaxID=319707 RepID=A0ABN5YPH6_9MYCO|nr:LysM peptidoglycan-binding domain-containing protein [Mycolicibacterium aubagnense]TLH61688.1 lectin [Mycolicibacterium aubagnense]WGI35175.1 LysM peptidoglycan-binding domain-containing protein [Mycolicibacterium aubagnense]BBX82875.1 lectin [Mycolicibacterium aubagnense]
MGDTLQKGEKLEVGQSLTSNNGAYRLVLQEDGNLVLYAGEQSVWATATDGQDVQRAEVQDDGNFVLYTPDKPVWASQTAGTDNVRLVLQDDRNLVLYSGDDAKWSSETHTDEVPASPVEAAPEPAAEPEFAEVAAEPAAVEVAADPEPAPEPEVPAARTYTVQSGDTLWAIAEQFYGDGNRYPEIAGASGIDNPDLIQPGQLLTIP